MKRCCKLDAAACNFAHGERDLRIVDKCNSTVPKFDKFNSVVPKFDKCNSVVPKLDKCDSVMAKCSLEASVDSSEKGSKLRSCLHNESRFSWPSNKKVHFAQFVDVVYIPAEGRGLSARSFKGGYSNEFHFDVAVAGRA